MTVREEKITVKPMNVVWGRRHKFQATTVADVADSLNGKYFTFEVPDADLLPIKFAPWIDTNAGVAPVVAGATLVQINSNTGDTATAIAAQIVVDLNLNATFAANAIASSVGAVVTITAKRPGAVAAAAVGTSTFTLLALQVGFGRDLGATNGGIEVSFNSDMTDVVADQLGTQILDKIITATNLEIGMTISELTKENWELLLGQVIGEVYTGGVTDVTGMGESKRFKNMSQYAGEMVLTPIGATDKLENMHFWKVYPNIDTVSFSGQDLNQMSLTWGVLRDTSKPKEINLMVYGDGEQAL